MCAAGLPAWCSGGSKPTTSDSNIFPSSRKEWAESLAKQGKIFGRAGIAVLAVPVLAPTAPVLAGTGIVLDGISKVVAPPSPFILVTDAVLDVAAASAPGGPLKDIGFEAIKELNSALDAHVEKDRAAQELMESHRHPPICKR